jgi:DNA polymerase
MLTYAIDDGQVFTWLRGQPMPYDLCLALIEGATVYIHNAEFDVTGWNEILAKRHGWPRLKYGQVRDTAAMAAAMGLPRSLDGAAHAVRLSVSKDADGAKLMKRMCKPAGWTDDLEPTWLEGPTEMARLQLYARQDIHVLRPLRRRLLDLRKDEQDVYELTTKINQRGVRIDLVPVRRAIPMVLAALGELNKAVADATGGVVQRAMQRDKLLAFLADHLVFLPNARRKTLELFKAQHHDELPEACGNVIDLRLDAAKTSVGKLNAMVNRVSPDGRLRGSTVYYGAGTGRFSSMGVQLQNLPRPSISYENCCAAVEALRTATRENMEWLYGPTLQLISDCLRSFIIPEPGAEFAVADFARIEAIVNAWAAGQRDLLQAFKEGRNVYVEMAQNVFHRPVTKLDKIEYHVGKGLVLGAGYGLGGPRFWEQCVLAGVPITMDFALDAISTYRQQNDCIVRNWYDQERAAIDAVWHPGQQVACGPVVWLFKSQILWCRLPSGRALAYPYARVLDKLDRNKTLRPRLHYWGLHPITHRWAELETYGAAVVENFTQAIARDLLVHVMLKAERFKVQNVLSVHDEVVTEGRTARNDLALLLDFMAQPPAWGVGIPLSAAGDVLPRYGKLE